MGFFQEICDICKCHWITTAKEKKLRNATTQSLLYGSEGCLKLNEQLKSYYVGTRLLGFKRKEFVKKLIPVWSRKSKRLPYSNLCRRCEGIVGEAMDARRTVIELQAKIKRLGETLKEFLRGFGEGGPTDKIKRTAPDMMPLSIACLGKLNNLIQKSCLVFVIN